MRPLLYVVLTIITLVATGCAGRVVTVKYHPLVNTKVIPTGGKFPPFAEAGPNEIISIYCITSIENKGKNALDFTFDTTRLYVDGGQILSSPGAPTWAWTAKSKVIPAHTTVSDLGTIIIKHGSGVDPAANDAWIQLKYTPGPQNTDGIEGQVLMIQVPPQPVPLFKQALDAKNMPVCPGAAPN